MSDDLYMNNHNDWQNNGPSNPPQGRLPPLDDKGLPLDKMNNKVGVDNPSFTPENGYPRQNGTTMNHDPEGGSHASVRSPSHKGDDLGGHHDEKPQKPLAFCSFIVNHHKLAFGLTLGGQIAMFVISGILLAAGYDLLPIAFDGVPLYLTKDDTYLRYMAWRYRDEDSIIIKPNTSASEVGKQTENDDILQVFFEADNVLTKARLTAIQNTENELTSVREWPDYCKIATIGGTCQKPTSLIRFFDGTYGINDPTFDNIESTLNTASANATLNQLLQGLLGHGYTLSPPRSHLTRSLLFFGVPQVGYDLTTDSKEDQADRIQDFQVDYWSSKLEDLFDDGIEGMDVYYTATQLLMHDTIEQVIYDMMLAVGSMVFIFVFMIIQTQSLWLTCFALLGILGSFVGTNLIYRIVMDYKYFGIFHILSIFIILGIGADDIFVFNDTWRATGLEDHPSLADRLSAAYRRASMSMLTTTLTTFVAFVANAISPLLGIGAFGIFSAVLVAVNYLSAIIFFPAVVIFYHKHFEDWTWPCCRPLNKLKFCQPSQEDKPNFMVRFFDGPYYKFITHKVFRWVSIAICSGLLALFIYFASTLEVDAKGMQFFRDGYNYQEAAVRNRDGFEKSLDDKDVEVYIMFGLKNQDIDSCHKTDYECKGKSVWAESFDLNPKPSQSELVALCDYIRNNLPQEPRYDNVMRVKRDPATSQVEMECFITVLNDYMTAQSTQNLNNMYGTSPNFTFPISEIKYQAFFNAHSDPTNASDYLYENSRVSGTNFYRYFETVKNFWLFNGYGADKTEDYRIYSVKLGESADDDTGNITKPDFTDQLYGTHLRYAGIMIKTTLTSGTLKYDDGLDMLNAWEDFVREQVSKLPPSLGSGVPVTPSNDFHDFKVKETLASSAFQGIIIGICLAFVVLTVATSNVILSSLATLTITAVTFTITGLIPMMGWKLSVIESVNLSLVVGLSVDYVVHLSEAYNHANDLDRVVKVRHMLRSMGVSIVSGAFSTLGASSFMMGAVLQFFFQFGVFVFGTIGFSLLYSLCLFTPILSMIGPVGTMGSLKPLVKRIKYKIQGRGMDDPTCEPCEGKGFIKTSDQNTDL